MGTRRIGRTLHPVLRVKIYESGLSLEELSEITGVLPEIIDKWATGRALVPHMHKGLLRLMEYFGVTSEDLQREQRQKLRLSVIMGGASQKRQPKLRPRRVAQQQHERPAEPEPEERSLMARCLYSCPADCAWRYAYNGHDRCRLFAAIPPAKICIFYLTDSLRMPCAY